MGSNSVGVIITEIIDIMQTKIVELLRLTIRLSFIEKCTVIERVCSKAIDACLKFVAIL